MSKSKGKKRSSAKHIAKNQARPSAHEQAELVRPRETRVPGILFFALWLLIIIMTFSAIAELSGRYQAARESETYASQTFIIGCDDHLYTKIFFGIEGEADETTAREHVLSYAAESAAKVDERLFANAAFYLLALSPFLGALVFAAKSDGTTCHALYTLIALAAVFGIHILLMLTSYLVMGAPIALERLASIAFIACSVISVIAGSCVAGLLLKRIGYPLIALAIALPVLYMLFSLDIVFGADVFRAILTGSQIPMGQLIYEVLVPFSGSGIALAEQIIREEGAGILPFWYVIPFIAKSALWITASFMVERRMSW